MQVDPINAGFSQEKLARIDRQLIENYLAPGKIAGCQVMVARRGTAAYFKSFGDMDRERARPVQKDTHLSYLLHDQANYVNSFDDLVRRRPISAK